MDETLNGVVDESVNSQTSSVSMDEDSMIPDGWDGVGDFFDDTSWNTEETTTSEVENVSDDPAENSEPDAADEASTIGDAEAEDTETVDDDNVITPKKLKFRAQVDHNDIDVELDEADLPTLYQKAQNLDRAQAKVKAQDTLVNQARALAKGMGYESAEKMFEEVAKNYRDAEIERLVNDSEHPVHPDMAADYVDQKLGFKSIFDAPVVEEVDSTPAPAIEPPAPTTVNGRDFGAEVKELIVSYPQLMGKQLPEEVMTLAVVQGVPLVEAYKDYERKRVDADNAKLRKENKTLKQNADSAAKAPVRGVTGRGATDTTPDDPFITGFDSVM